MIVIKAISRNLCIIMVGLFFVLIGTEKTFANTDELFEGQKAKVTITNDETGETTVIEEDITPAEIHEVQTFGLFGINSDDEGTAYEAGYEVFVPLEELEEDEEVFTVFGTNSGSKKSGGVTAKLSATYNLRNSNKQIQVTKIHGSWSPSASMYQVGSRSVGAHSGAVWGKNLKFNPTSNSFSRNTGWGYNDFAYGDASPRAWSSAKITVSGMSGTSHTINVEITYP